MNEAPEETGIQDSQTFDAYADTQPQLSLFTQFFTDTFGFFRERISSNLDNREAGAVLTRLTITGPPVPRGDGHYDYDEPDPDQKRKLVITRVALYVPFTARVQSPSKGPEIVQGALTSVIGNVNQPDNRVVRAWMDVDDFQRGRLMTPDTDVYQSRMLSVGEWLPSDFPPGLRSGVKLRTDLRRAIETCSIPVMQMGEGVEWGLHCLLALAWLEEQAPVATGRLAEIFELPPEYLKKRLQPLVRAGILTSTPGARGGYSLARRPEEITLMDVVAAVEGREEAFRCTEIRQQGAGALAAAAEFAEPCGIAKAMRRAEMAWRRELAAQTVAEVMGTAAEGAPARVRRFYQDIAL